MKDEGKKSSFFHFRLFAKLKPNRVKQNQTKPNQKNSEQLRQILYSYVKYIVCRENRICMHVCLYCFEPNLCYVPVTTLPTKYQPSCFWHMTFWFFGTFAEKSMTNVRCTFVLQIFFFCIFLFSWRGFSYPIWVYIRCYKW